jgi:DNA polymerase-3 subunit gamma/tau
MPDEQARLRPLAEAFSEEDVLRSMDLLTRLDWELKMSTDPRVTLELTLMKLAHLRRLRPLTEIAARLEGLSTGAAPSPRPAAPALPTPAPRPAPVAAPAPPPPAPKPQAAPEPVSSAPVDASSADDLLGAMRNLSRPSLAHPLRNAAARVEGDTLVLTFGPDILGFARMHEEDFKDLAKKAAGGRAFRIRVEAGEVSAPVAEEPPAPAPGAVPKKQLAEQAAQQPIVKEALDLFGGTVVDVRESSRNR